MYDSEESFNEDVLQCWDGAYYSNFPPSTEGLRTAYEIYRRVKEGTKISSFDGREENFGITIVGRLALSENGKFVPSNENFPSIDEIMKQNLRVVNEESEAIGSILDSNKWSLLANDSWLLGSIHAGTEFHFASPLREHNLWDENRNRITITGRELVGITSFGYEIFPTQLEDIAVCARSNSASNASFPEYKERVLRFRRREDIRQLLQELKS